MCIKFSGKRYLIKAAEIFIHELTLRAWVHTEDNKRRTLQRNDIAMAILSMINLIF